VPPIADPGDTWDRDPFLLGVQNGVVDLRIGNFRKAAPADRVTMRVRVAYDPSATCPLWLQTLSEIFAPQGLFTAADSGEMVAFMQRAVGYSITGDCREECCFFPWGDGRNGKGTLMNTLGWLLADCCPPLLSRTTRARATLRRSLPLPKSRSSQRFVF
jgi:putative DNA primase/helicase